MNKPTQEEIIYDLIIIGGGIVGLATAYKYQERFPNRQILVLEKEKELAVHQTGHNSGVIHSGIYYKPGSYKARTCVRGRDALVAFAEKHKVPHDICGKLILATDGSELEAMNRIFTRGKANGLKGIEILTPSEIKDVEPFCEGVAAILVPSTGIIDYRAVSNKLAEIIQSKDGCSVRLEHEVKVIDQGDEVVEVRCEQGTFKGKQLVSCAGLQADRVAKKTGAKPSAAIVPFRGDYYELEEASRHKVKHLIYPVPNPKFPFLGVHFTRMIDGSIECGPNAVFAFKREGYHRAAFSLQDTAASLSNFSLWRFFAQHWRYGLMEYHRAWSKKQFLYSLQKMIPSLAMSDIKPCRAGVRAMALASGGKMLDDFKIETHGRAVHVLNAPSPAATASLAIGEEIVGMIV